MGEGNGREKFYGDACDGIAACYSLSLTLWSEWYITRAGAPAHPHTLMPHRRTQPIRRKVKNWTASDSAELYGVQDWSNDFFGVSKNGETTVRLVDSNGEYKNVSLVRIMRELRLS